METSKTVKLSFPFTSSSNLQVDEITLRRPKVGDLIDVGDIDKIPDAIKLCSNLSGMSPQDIMKNIDGYDFTMIRTELINFLYKKPEA